MASRVGAPVNVTFGASFTVPSGANAFIASGIWYDGANQAVTNVSGSRVTVDNVAAVASSGSMGVYSVRGRVNSSGSDTWSITKAGLFSEGPTCQVQFYSVADNTNFVRDIEVVGDWPVTDTSISRTVDSSTTDLVDAWILSDGGGTVSNSISGFTAVGTEQTVNADKSRVFQANSPGATSTSITGPPNGYAGLVIASIYDAGGTSYELTVTPGSYTLTGSSARLRRAALLRTTAGSYTLTGVSARLNLVRRLLVSPGSYSLTGFSARTERDALVNVTPGSYSLTGSSARLESDRRLEMSPGSYALTGSDAELIYTQPLGDFELLVTPGAYSLTGSNAGLAADRLLIASPGSYSLTGSSARLNVARLLRTTAGSYALTGSSARLESDRVLRTTAGSYAITGFDAELDYQSLNKELIVIPGAYSLTGYPAELSYSGGAMPSGGSSAAVYLAKPRKTRWEIELERLKKLPDQVAEVIKAEAVEVLEQPQRTVSRQRKDLREALRQEGIAYREAYREVLTELVQEMRRLEDEEEEEAVIALLI